MSSVQSTIPSMKSLEAGDIRRALEDALVSADSILKVAKSDKQRIAEAVKMNDVDTSSGSDRLEQLRWYMHPKECASLLAQGIDDVPGTELPVLVGGLNPLSFAESPNVAPTYDNMLIDTPTTIPPPARDRKRKQTNLQTSVVAEADVEIQIVSEDQPLCFRDGEHSGEAPLSEIELGFDDEELSDRCEVFDEQTGAWVQIEAFLQAAKKSKTTIPSAEEKKTDSEPLINTSLGSVPTNGTLDTKNEKKKPSRGSTTWGQGSFAQPPTVAVSSEMNHQPRHFEEQKPPETTFESKNHASPEKKKPKKNKFKHIMPPPKMMRLITQAVIQWNMIEEGDRLLLGLSGGKDSLSLLHGLLECKRKMPINFEIEVCTIDPMTPSFDPSPLIPYVESLGLKYHYIRDNIVNRANAAGKDGKIVSSLCAYCARMKRGNLYTCARTNKCNKLVLAQHLDDCAESFLMSVMHNGFLRTMKAHYKIDAGDLSVIRPMVYCRESLMTNFAKSENLPVINENCPGTFIGKLDIDSEISLVS